MIPVLGRRPTTCKPAPEVIRGGGGRLGIMPAATAKKNRLARPKAAVPEPAPDPGPAGKGHGRDRTAFLGSRHLRPFHAAFLALGGHPEGRKGGQFRDCPPFGRAPGGPAEVVRFSHLSTGQFRAAHPGGRGRAPAWRGGECLSLGWAQGFLCADVRRCIFQPSGNTSGTGIPVAGNVFIDNCLQRRLHSDQLPRERS
jgi:hypothetical protein